LNLPGVGDASWTPEHDLVRDALCFMQAPVTASQLAQLLACHNALSGRRGAFHAAELRQSLDILARDGEAMRDVQGRWTPRDGGAARFRDIVLDPEARSRWWASWREERNFERGYGLNLRDEAGLVGAIRVVTFAGGTQRDFRRLFEHAYAVSHHWGSAFRRALLDPFQPALMDQLEPALQQALAAALLEQSDGNAQLQEAALLDWLLARLHAPGTPWPEVLHTALAEALIHRGQLAEAQALVAPFDSPQSDAVRAAARMAAGDWAAGASAFEAAWKGLAAVAGKRKHLVAPSLSWLYPMALLARPEPAAWQQARKFVATEAGKRVADPFTFWGLWQEAIDQRLGDAPSAPRHFQLAPWGYPAHALVQLHHLLLAAWLRLDVPDAPQLRQHAAQLAQRHEDGGQRWLAALARRAAAALLHEAPDAADAALPFFIHEAQPQEGWRETLAAVLALDGAPASAAAAGSDRLVWTLRVDANHRIAEVAPLEQKTGVRGGFGKPKPVTVAALTKRRDLPPHDAAVLRAVEREPYGQRAVLNPVLAVQALLHHPHVAWSTDPLHFIALEETLPALELSTRGEHIVFCLLDPVRPATPAIDRDLYDAIAEPVRRQQVQRQHLLVIADGPDRARLIRLTPAQLRVAELVAKGWQVPAQAKGELDAALRVLASHFQIHSDAEAGQEVAASTVLRAELTPQGAGLLLRLLAAPFGDFGPRLPAGAGRESVTTVHQGATLFTRRDLAAERAGRLALLQALPALDDGSNDEWLLDDAEHALAAVEALAGLAPAIVTEWPKGRPLRVRRVEAEAVKVALRSQGKDWLSLDGEVALDGGEVLRLRELLARLTPGSRYVALAEGDFIALGDALRQQLSDLDALAQPHKNGQRLNPLAASAWAAQSGLAVDGDAAWRQRCEAWDAAQSASINLPAGLQADLRDYQADGVRWLCRLAAAGFGACLADDMGLGKTLQTLAVLLARAAGGPALVVAPTSVCSNWMAEALRFAPGLAVSLYGNASDAAMDDDSDAAPTDSARQAARRRQLRSLGPGQLLVCSYALLQIDAELLTERRWHTVVLDEAQAIKNAGTHRARAALALQADFRLALTGTPIENRLAELWAIMAFANPGLLGSAEQFAQRFANPIERDGDSQAVRRLRRLVSPFLLRRTKADVLVDLPPRTEIVHEVLPGPRERTLLEALRQEAEASVNQVIAQGEGPAQMHVLAALTRLRRAACDPRLVAPELGLVGAKVQEFERLAQELVAGRHKALVFSQFVDFLHLLRERLDAAGLSYQMLDGSTPAAERGKRVAAFQAGEGDFFLISLKAGGFGLNLTVADYVIIADPWWNPAAEDQASARAHRIGQQRPVTVYRLVTQGSIEARIVQLHRSKRDLADGILSGQQAASPLDAGQLMALLKGEDEPS
jgi:superfamily II DNA or RNA helicase